MTHPIEGDRTGGDSANPTTEKLIRIMRTNAPILHFSKDEKYFTYNVPDYLKVVDVCDANNHHVIAKAPLTKNNLPSGKPSSSTYLSIPKQHDGVEKGDRSKTEVYVHAVGWNVDGNAGFDFQYFFFYAYNGPGTLRIKLMGIDAALDIGISAGAHQGDWESVIVRTDTNGKVIAIYCNQHDSGAWYQPHELTWSAGHPNIYVANSGHPSYIRIGHFYNWSHYIPEIDVELHLVNETSNGPSLQTVGIVNLVATTLGSGAKVDSPPWWLDYRGRYGLVVFTKQDEQDFEDNLTDEVQKIVVIREAAREIAEKITEKLYPVLEQITPDGPEAPIAKSWWGAPIPGGPWRYQPYWWSGDVRISDLPGSLDPKSDLGPSMAAHGDDVYMVYKGESSDTLYSARRDKGGWHGNKPIEVSKRTLESDSTPGLASYGGRIYTVYKGDSDALFSAYLENGSWHGNNPLTTPKGPPKSSGSPALAEFGGMLYIAYKGQGSNTLYYAWFDGNSWRGNVPIADAGTSRVAESETTPALVVYLGVLYLIYLDADSGNLEFARFDREVWELDGPVSVDGNTLTSPNAPSAAVVDGSLMILFLGKRALLPRSDILWAAYDEVSGAWRGNERIGQSSSIRPQSDHQVGLTAFGSGLVAVYKGAGSNEFYQAEFIRHA